MYDIHNKSVPSLNDDVYIDYHKLFKKHGMGPCFSIDQNNKKEIVYCNSSKIDLSLLKECKFERATIVKHIHIVNNKCNKNYVQIEINDKLI